MPNNRKKKNNNNNHKKNKNRNKNNNKSQNQQQPNVTKVIFGVALTPPQDHDQRQQPPQHQHADDERKSDVDEQCNYRR